MANRRRRHKSSHRKRRRGHHKKHHRHKKKLSWKKMSFAMKAFIVIEAIMVFLALKSGDMGSLFAFVPMGVLIWMFVLFMKKIFKWFIDEFT